MEEPQIIKRKKGRPKKEKKENSDDLLNKEIEKPIKEKKKRGRKKKEIPIQQEEIIKQKKKRGRKAAVKYFSSSIRKKIPLTTVIKDNDNYILHIDVKNDEKTIEKIDNLSINEKPDSFEIKNIEKNQVIDSLPKEIKDILNEDSNLDDDLLTNLIDSENDNNSEKNIKDLYEKRLEFREKQDQILSVKLEEMHKDENFINQLIENNENNQNNETHINNPDNYLKTKSKIQESNKKKGFFELLYDFVHNTEWLHKTDICCWWCCHEFDDVPIGLPIEFNKKINKFMVKGVFCSFACMLAYKDEKKLNDKTYLINYLYTKLTGDMSFVNRDKNNTLRPAPPRCTLKMFGGELSIEEFRQSSKENKIYKMIEYPMCVHNDYVEEVDIENIKNANSKLFNKESLSKLINLDDKRVHDAQTRLSKMEPTVITNSNTIDKFIKFS
jgi:hypothetical protein